MMECTSYVYNGTVKRQSGNVAGLKENEQWLSRGACSSESPVSAAVSIVHQLLASARLRGPCGCVTESQGRLPWSHAGTCHLL